MTAISRIKYPVKELTLDGMKKEMKKYRDYFGGDLLNASDIDAAKSKKDLMEIISKHYAFISDMANDAQRDLEKFQKSIGLSLLDIDE